MGLIVKVPGEEGLGQLSLEHGVLGTCSTQVTEPEKRTKEVASNGPSFSE